MDKPALFSDVELRAYFASVVGAFRAPFGKRGGGLLPIGQSLKLAQNSTADHVMSVTVTRSDTAGTATTIIFSQSQAGAASNNDYVVLFTATGKERFILKPGDQLSAQNVGQGDAALVVGQETT